VKERLVVLGVDIGGTKLAVGSVDVAGRIIAAARVPTPAREGPQRVLSLLINQCKEVLAVTARQAEKIRIVAVGVGCGGPLDPERGIIYRPPNLPGWEEVHLGEILAEELGYPVYVENDGNAAALGELRFGAGRGVKNFVYLTISTGIGSGIVIDGKLYRGENGNAGEIGHMCVAYEGRPCHCGSRGCLEAYASGSSVARRAREAAAQDNNSLLLKLAGDIESIRAETVVAAVKQGDPVAMRVWEEATLILGVGIANVINIFNPRLVILGGGLTQAGDLLFVPVRQVALSRAFSHLARVVEIVPASLGERVGVLGAAAVAWERVAERVFGEESELNGKEQEHDAESVRRYVRG